MHIWFWSIAIEKSLTLHCQNKTAYGIFFFFQKKKFNTCKRMNFLNHLSKGFLSQCSYHRWTSSLSSSFTRMIAVHSSHHHLVEDNKLFIRIQHKLSTITYSTSTLIYILIQCFLFSMWFADDFFYNNISSDFLLSCVSCWLHNRIHFSILPYKKRREKNQKKKFHGFDFER